MKYRKIYTIIFILILYFTFILQLNDTIFYKHDNKSNRTILPILSTGDATVYKWNRTWGGSDSECGKGVAVDSSGNIYVAGTTGTLETGGSDMCLVKYDSSGVQQWTCTWGGSSSDYGSGVAVDSSGNIYVAGTTGVLLVNFYRYLHPICGDMCLVKYDSSGAQQWNRTWGGSSGDYGSGVAVDSSGNIYIAGYTESFGAGSWDMCLVKYDSSGVQQWNRTWGGRFYDAGHGLTLDSSGNIYIVGYTRSFGAGNYDMCLVKYDSSGVQQWNRTWGGSDEDYGNGVAVDSSGNIYIAGYTGSFGAGGGDMYLVKYDSSGVQQWNRTWGGRFYDTGHGLTLDSLGNIYIVGYTSSFGAGYSDMCLVKYDSSGAQQWNRTWGGIFMDEGFGLTLDSLGNIYIVGRTWSFGAGAHDMCLVKFFIDSDGDGFSDEEEALSGYDPNNKWSNPFMSMVIITIIIILAILGVLIFIVYPYIKRNREKERLERELEERERREKESV